ncbi:hypothetical protein B0T20DRAFT_87025 [Sordaria brevicollis]|uniref:RED-like N-terminal domain-containing protein n=1 Tax=Sordaria brevicollis TaxID=83679 RepID=A0AAE0NWQ1_SORBR|nr:hypothetical protein B0T20DRAFT_87025 [Sordaria brevicollis]
MNNEQFRRLLLANAQKDKNNHQNGSASPPSKSPSAPAPAGSATPRTLALGSRARSSIPMTPRSVAGFNPRNEFARQLAERNAASSSSQQHPNKKIRTSAPKGSRLAEGYVDRAKQRQAQEEADERERKLKELEERFKKEEISKEEYERLQQEIIGGGGDLNTAHLIKGLDFKLLERVRKGEVDVFGEKTTKSQSPEVEEEKQVEEEKREIGEDPDDVLEQLESAEIKAKEKQQAEKKKGEFATTTLLPPGAKKTRNQILAELKAARAAAKAKEESSLGSRFKKIGPQKKQAGTRIERDERGNEIMIIVDEDGNERRKVRRVDAKKTREEQEKEREALAAGKVLGMDVPEYYKKLEEEKRAAEAMEEDKEPNIFDDVESDYDPLAGLESDGSDGESDKEDGEVEDSAEKKKTDMPPPPKPAAADGPRNYFSQSKTGLVSQEEYKKPSLDDPTFRAALAKAKAISAAEKSEEERLTAEREARLRKKLLESSRDDEDLDMGFGSSRMEDDADLDESSSKVKLSEWNGDDDEDEYEGGGKAGLGSSKGKRKRGGGKKGGDKNNFADVMKVMERNKAKE